MTSTNALGRIWDGERGTGGGEEDRRALRGTVAGQAVRLVLLNFPRIPFLKGHQRHAL